MFEEWAHGGNVRRDQQLLSPGGVNALGDISNRNQNFRDTRTLKRPYETPTTSDLPGLPPNMSLDDLDMCEVHDAGAGDLPDDAGRGAAPAQGIHNNPWAAEMHAPTQQLLMDADPDVSVTLVTIFGFPSNFTGDVMRKFQSYGEVVNHKIGPGNWIHLQYRTTLQAQKALSQNGECFKGAIMLGVKRCTDEEFPPGVDADGVDATGFGTTPAKGNLHARDQLRNRHRPRASQAYSVSEGPIDIMAPPAKRVNICTKLVEFVFNL
jgi:hypothetical protein